MVVPRKASRARRSGDLRLPARRPATVQRLSGAAAPGVEPSPETDAFPEIDGVSPAVRQLKGEMLAVSRDPDVTVLILGESGTGKERVARAIHRASPRGQGPFVVVDCAGLSSSLVEDELFGHVRGAFTGAVDSRAGPFERAARGAVFLDEVGDLTPAQQMKLLRVVQERTVQRIGGTKETAFDVRVIAATNVDLAAAAAGGRFRHDLYYRLDVYEIVVPPLRRRGPDDVRLLIDVILARCAGRRGRPAPALDADALDRLVRYDWPGNVRELENVLERMVVAAGTDTRLTPQHFPGRFGHAAPAPDRRLPSTAELVAVLDRHGPRRAEAAVELGLSRHQLYRLVRRYGLGTTPRRPA